MSALEKANEPEDERKSSAFKPKIPKIESDADESNFECCDDSDGEPIQVNIDKEVTEGGAAMALLPIKLEEIEKK